MKSIPALVLALAVAGVSAPASAQTPPTETLPTEQPAAPAPPPEVVSRHQTVLTSTIAGMQAGKPDYGSMVPQLADAVRQQEAAITPALQQLGEVKTIAYDGVVQGALKFKVAFANGETTWIIALGPDGKIAGLVFR